MQRVVLDTNVAISAALSKQGAPAKVYELVLEGKLLNFTTVSILQELEEVFQRFIQRRKMQPAQKEFMMQTFKLKSFTINSKFDERIVTQDPADNKFINCALTAKALIISGDKHLLRIKQFGGIRIFSPSSFLKYYLRSPLTNPKS